MKSYTLSTEKPCFTLLCIKSELINLGNLISDILKHTNKNNQDYTALEQALSSIREVMTHINEDKRKTEGQLVMFDIFNEIDNCPVSLVQNNIFWVKFDTNHFVN